MLRMTSLPPRRVLMTTDALGGVWRYSVDLARGLRGLGVETVLAGFGPPPDACQRQEAEAVADLHWTGEPLDWMVEEAGALSAVPSAIAELVSRTGADTVQVNLPSQAAGLKTRARVVAVGHSCVVSWFRAVRHDDVPDHWLWQHALNAEGLARADLVVTPTVAHGALMRRCYPGLGPVAVVPNAATPTLAPHLDRPVIHAAARWWDAGKDAATLDAMAALTEWPVAAIGPTSAAGGETVAFRHVRALGALPHDAVLRAAARAGICVSPSAYEPFGLAALEAAMAGTALVLADIPSYREIWEGAALFAPPGDAAAFAAAANRLARDATLRRRMAEAARARAQGFTPTRQAEAMRDLFRQPVPAKEPA